MSTYYRVGIDVGSTTVKIAVLNRDGELVFSDYQRHFAHIQETLTELLTGAESVTGGTEITAVITGSGGLNLAKHMGLPFVQEVVATASAVKRFAPKTDVAIELGGEDAKIIYFTGGVEQRMNGICAGGTGSFIDQMAALLQTDATGLNEFARTYHELYPIAARCGVFAKSDIQPLINEGARKEDLAASIFQAVVNQTISGLACGKPIRGCVAFLGGPLHFLPELRAAFIRTLKLTEETAIIPENSHLFAAVGAALNAEDAAPTTARALVGRLTGGITMAFEMGRLEPLFRSEDDYAKFKARHGRDSVHKADISTYTGKCYLGIDAGSTTTKAALVSERGELLYSFYRNNNGSPLQTAVTAIREIEALLPTGVHIARSCSTGYGESLIKSALMLDEGEVETIAHYTAASFFDPEVDCILDIGGQDMKFIRIHDKAVDSILLNEACSSGCGSFIENFANSLGFTAAEFAKEALFAKNPVDLGTRCTVFMNSNVKQAQKEGAEVSDISAGLAYSVIKNALYKVIKITNPEDLGKHVVVQGGTFYNDAVLRSFERIAGCEVICPDISGIMGAFGAALIARERFENQPSSMLSFREIDTLEFKTTLTRCKGCTNSCLLTVNHFSGDRKYITGNRCERGLGKTKTGEDVPNLFDYKLRRTFDFEPLGEKAAVNGVIGIPRVLNLYENYPFWAVLFRELGFRVVLSPLSSRKIYELGMDSIPSESECYPAKLAHGHVQWLIDSGVRTIFYPCITDERAENPKTRYHYNCPIVATYPENILNNVEDLARGEIRFIRPFMAFTDENILTDRLVGVFAEKFSIGEDAVRAAAHKAWGELLRARDDIRAEGERALCWMEEHGRRGIVLAGRPYHIDPEIHHGIPEMIASYGIAVLTEDSVSHLVDPVAPLRVSDQWVYHSRLYSAADFVKRRDDLDLVQLNSFGCGLDAVTTDQVSEILTHSDKIYTVLKIDEVNNLGAARIRIRSLIAALRMRERQAKARTIRPSEYHRAEFTQKMKDEGYTILCPQMSPIHFDLLEPIFRKFGYNLEVLKNDDRNAIDVGLKYVNNDACFPSLTVVGQIMDAVMSGKYDTGKLAIVMSQTGGGCRASNYVAFIRRALEKEGLGHIPVISVNANGMEKNEGFKITLPLAARGIQAVIYGDLFMRVLYRIRPYEAVPGSADNLHAFWLDQCVASLMRDHLSYREFKRNIDGIVRDFDRLPLVEGLQKPRVGIVGEILVKFMPLANNNLVGLLEREGAEAVVPDLLDFLNYCFYSSTFKSKFLGGKKSSALISRLAIRFIERLRKPARNALERSSRFEPPVKVEKLAELSRPLLSLGNQCGEGWFLSGEMMELLHGGVKNIVCVQPFACLPNHVVGKGVIKKLHRDIEGANVVAIDYDPGASEVNQLNRIKLMLSTAKTNLAAEEAAPLQEKLPDIPGRLDSKPKARQKTATV